MTSSEKRHVAVINTIQAYEGLSKDCVFQSWQKSVYFNPTNSIAFLV